jgi:hypothetical protein
MSTWLLVCRCGLCEDITHATVEEIADAILLHETRHNMRVFDQDAESDVHVEREGVPAGSIAEAFLRTHVEQIIRLRRWSRAHGLGEGGV